MRKLILIATLLLGSGNAFGTVDYKTSTETYKGETYEILDYGYFNIVNNKKHM